MNIDFHYGVMYVLSRLGGLSKEDAETVAHASQYVDDATVPGVLVFEEGQTYERFASAHSMLDYKNLINDDDKLVWAPFHFLPGGSGTTLDEKAVCKPNSDIAKEMVRHAIAGKNSDNSLHRLGITLHVYVDTWAHQGFTGTRSKRNHIIKLSGDDHDEKTWRDKLENFLTNTGDTVVANFLDLVSGLGHGAAIHFPDMPWAKWEYTDATGAHHVRDNLPQFIEAAHWACKAVQGYVAAKESFETEVGLSPKQQAEFSNLFSTNRSHDEKLRLSTVCDNAGKGAISGFNEAVPTYIAKGPGSWKCAATGIETGDDGTVAPKWSMKFEDSDYRKFHDAIKQHRFVITQEILPKYGIRLA